MAGVRRGPAALAVAALLTCVVRIAAAQPESEPESDADADAEPPPKTEPEPEPVGVPEPEPEPVPEEGQGELPPDIVLDEELLYDAELREPYRFMIGFDFGIGVYDATCKQCPADGGLALDVYLGAIVHRRIAILLDVFSVLHLLPVDEPVRGVVSNNHVSAVARVWLFPTVWIEGGGGLNVFARNQTGDDIYQTQPGWVLSIGTEQKHRPHFGIDFTLRMGAAVLEDDGDRALLYDVAGLVGFHWQ